MIRLVLLPAHDAVQSSRVAQQRAAIDDVPTVCLSVAFLTCSLSLLEAAPSSLSCVFLARCWLSSSQRSRRDDGSPVSFRDFSYRLTL
jgi:hypothetical protein